jgi:HPt (histidine-containing phosphotransfer) domain-containing protein
MDENRMEKSPITVPVDEDVIDLIPRYIENRWKDIRTIEVSIENGDFETVRTLAHSMKGSGGGYGLDQVSAIGSGIEDSANAMDSDKTRLWLDKLADFLERVEVIPE